MEENKTKLIEILKDPKEYLERFCRIKGKKPGLIPFMLNEAQKDLFNTLLDSPRVIIRKCRQLGFSTAVTGFFYHLTITVPGITTALIGYNSDLTAELLDKVKTFYRTTPDELKPTIHYNSKYEISFPILDSKILVLPSTEEVGRGYTLHNVLATEFAFWEKAEEKMSILEASVPIDGKMVIESTPGNIGDAYYRRFMGDNDYVKKDYGWWWGYSKEEIEIIRRRMNNPRRFSQEYELQFASSGRPVFDLDVVQASMKNIWMVGDKVIDLDENGVEVEKEVCVENDLRIYRQPRKDRFYVCGVDVSEGVDGGDYSVVTIFDRTTGEEVAFYRGLIAPDLLSQKLNDWGRKYNNALMVIEVNNHGLTTITVLKQLLYPSMFFRPTKIETLSQTTVDKIGWKTTKVTRPLLIDDLAQAVRDGVLTFHSKEVYDEMLTFIYNANNDPIAQDGYHDDCIFSSGIAFQGFKVMWDKPLTQLDYQQHLPRTFAY
jgi:hypothetical protein